MSLAYKTVLHGPDPEVLEALAIPEVQAVIIPGAWSEPSYRFARRLALAGQTLRTKTGASFQNIKGIVDQEGDDAEAFRSDLDRFTTMFKELGGKLKCPGKFRDQSRVEYRAPDPQRHIDGGSLGLLAIPYGPGTQFLNRIIPGRFEGINFFPKTKSAVELYTENLKNGSVMIFKAAQFPFGRKVGRALIHNSPEMDEQPNYFDLARVVIHYQMKLET